MGIQEILMERKDIEDERKEGKQMEGVGEERVEVRKTQGRLQGREKGREQGDCCWGAILTSLLSLSYPKPEQ